MKLSKIILLCLCSVILTGCQEKTVVDVESSAEETTMATTTAIETYEEKATEAETEEVTPSPQLPDVGSWDGNTYHNEFAQLTFYLPSQWESTLSEDIPEKLGLDEEMLKAQPSATFAMLAINPTNYAAVTLSFENLDMVYGGSKFTVQDFSDNLKLVVSQGHDYKFENLYEKELGGNIYTVLECNLPEYGLGLHYYLRKVDNIIVCLALNYTPNESIEEILEYFE